MNLLRSSCHLILHACRLALAGFIAASCLSATAPADGATVAPSSPVAEDDGRRRADESDGLTQGMLAFFGTHPVPLSIIRGLAPRLAETKSFEPNPHVENTTFTFYRFDFDGLVVTGMTFAPELLTLSSVTVTTPAWPIGHGLHVGVSEQAVIDALGPPTDKEVGMLHYDGVSDSMTFRIRAQRVTQVEFDFYVD